MRNDGIKIINPRTFTDSWMDTINLELRKEDIGYIKSASFCSSGEYAVLSIYNQIRIWNTNNGSIVKTVGINEIAHTSVYYAAFSPDAHYIAATSMDQKIRIWNIQTGDCINLPHRSFTPHFVSFSMDSKYLVALSFNNEIKIWDVVSGICIRVINVNNDVIRYATFSQDSKHILTISDNKTIKIWNISQGICVQELIGHKDDVSWAVFNPNSNVNNVLSISKDNTIKIWDWCTGRCLTTIESTNDSHSLVSFDSHGNSFVSISDNQIKIYRSPNWECIKTINFKDNIKSVWFNGETIKTISNYKGYHIYKWYVPTLQNLIDNTTKRLKEHQLTPEERKQYYLE